MRPSKWTMNVRILIHAKPTFKRRFSCNPYRVDKHLQRELNNGFKSIRGMQGIDGLMLSSDPLGMAENKGLPRNEVVQLIRHSFLCRMAYIGNTNFLILCDAVIDTNSWTCICNVCENDGQLEIKILKDYYHGSGTKQVTYKIQKRD